MYEELLHFLDNSCYNVALIQETTWIHDSEYSTPQWFCLGSAADRAPDANELCQILEVHNLVMLNSWTHKGERACTFRFGEQRAVGLRAHPSEGHLKHGTEVFPPARLPLGRMANCRRPSCPCRCQHQARVVR